jgi:flavin-dependent dehydrogenase
VKRADFDLLLATQAKDRGARINYGTRVRGWSREANRVVLDCQGETEEFSVACRFLVDASGFGRVLAKLADLEYPSDLPARRAIFHHLKHPVLKGEFDRNKITIAQARMDLPYWFWFIPFTEDTASFGLVGDADLSHDNDLQQSLSSHVATMPLMQQWVSEATPLTQTRTIVGYSCNVKQLFGERFVLLGNAGEFVDPIFSSGVSIACRSAIMAAPLVVRELRGESVDWREEYELPLRSGVNVFHVFVKAWYEGTLSRLIYSTNKHDLYRRHISSILAGYVWDRNNPFTRVTVERLRTLARVAEG